MKKKIALFILICVMLTGCELIPAMSTVPPETTAPAQTAYATEPPTEAPTEVVYTNPLTGEPTDGPQESRIFAVTINNLQDAMPRVGVCLADIYMEMYVNDSIVRGLALYTDPSYVMRIGPVRSTRYMFTDLALHYNLIVAHAGGSSYVLNDIAVRGADEFNIDTQDSTYYSMRDMDRYKENGYKGWEHCLFALGEGLAERAQEEGIDTSADPQKDYLLHFREDGTPENGEAAVQIDLTLTYNESKKECGYVYDENVGRYVYWQYGTEMTDGLTGEKETYENILIIFPYIKANAYGYQEADFVGGGSGYYACGGKIVPITFGAEDEYSPLQFFNADGSVLELGVGRTFIAITQEGSALSWS